MLPDAGKSSERRALELLFCLKHFKRENEERLVRE